MKFAASAGKGSKMQRMLELLDPGVGVVVDNWATTQTSDGLTGLGVLWQDAQE